MGCETTDYWDYLEDNDHRDEAIRTKKGWEDVDFFGDDVPLKPISEYLPSVCKDDLESSRMRHKKRTGEELLGISQRLACVIESIRLQAALCGNRDKEYHLRNIGSNTVNKVKDISSRFKRKAEELLKLRSEKDVFFESGDEARRNWDRAKKLCRGKRSKIKESDKLAVIDFDLDQLFADKTQRISIKHHIRTSTEKKSKQHKIFEDLVQDTGSRGFFVSPESYVKDKAKCNGWSNGKIHKPHRHFKEKSTETFDFNIRSTKDSSKTKTCAELEASIITTGKKRKIDWGENDKVFKKVQTWNPKCQDHNRFRETIPSLKPEFADKTHQKQALKVIKQISNPFVKFWEGNLPAEANSPSKAISQTKSNRSPSSKDVNAPKITSKSKDLMNTSLCLMKTNSIVNINQEKNTMAVKDSLASKSFQDPVLPKTTSTIFTAKSDGRKNAKLLKTPLLPECEDRNFPVGTSLHEQIKAPKIDWGQNPKVLKLPSHEAKHPCKAAVLPLQSISTSKINWWEHPKVVKHTSLSKPSARNDRFQKKTVPFSVKTAPKIDWGTLPSKRPSQEAKLQNKTILPPVQPISTPKIDWGQIPKVLKDKSSSKRASTEAKLQSNTILTPVKPISAPKIDWGQIPKVLKDKSSSKPTSKEAKLQNKTILTPTKLISTPKIDRGQLPKVLKDASVSKPSFQEGKLQHKTTSPPVNISAQKIDRGQSFPVLKQCFVSLKKMPHVEAMLLSKNGIEISPATKTDGAEKPKAMKAVSAPMPPPREAQFTSKHILPNKTDCVRKIDFTEQPMASKLPIPIYTCNYQSLTDKSIVNQKVRTPLEVARDATPAGSIPTPEVIKIFSNSTTSFSNRVDTTSTSEVSFFKRRNRNMFNFLGGIASQG